ncbi:hypothetical protein P691DRAFT_800558 [Macrolepiota fuliginosa MF-IS2]|uniref:Uncharacterized protein n=1 Tax=Macrolepiota fuliginosa MF-IS2 TaxID=1400762 RepID=A0A9P5XDZ2_9AGAR|nr:hypothetical protein P691DRAFT_800558 [Macrolepiota fuliginosa MF-IS2]
MSSSPKPLGISPSWATNGLCISGFPLSGSTPAHSLMNNVLAPVDQFDPFPPWSSQADFAAHSPLLFLDPPDRISDDEGLPEDFVGVLNVGYPLRPSEGRYGLVGLGFPSGMETQDRRERQEVGLLSPEFMEDSDCPSLSSPSMDHNSTLDFDASVVTPRELFVIAEADDEDWVSSELPAGSPMLVDEPSPVLSAADESPAAGRLVDDTFECLPHSQLHPLLSPYSPYSPASPLSELESTNNTVHSVVEAIPPSSLASITVYSPESVVVHDDVPHDLGFIERLRYRKRGPADDLFQAMF